MKRQYTVEVNGVIWYEENGVRVSFMPNEANSDYREYRAWLAEGNIPEPWNPDRQ